MLSDKNNLTSVKYKETSKQIRSDKNNLTSVKYKETSKQIKY